MITLHSLRPANRRARYKRVGRGGGSGKGTTAGRGTKGQRARTGGRNKLTRRGMKQLIERTPKLRGFRSRSQKLHVVTLAQLEQAFNQGTLITPAAMHQAGLINRIYPGVKVLGGGKIAKKLTIKADKFSTSASGAITAVGGTAVVIEKPAPKKKE